MPQPIKRSEVVENDIFKALIAEMERGKVVNDELNKSLKETATLVKSGITGMAKPKDLTALQEANLKLKEANQLFQQKLRLVEQEKKDAILVEKLKREEIRTQEMINKGAEREIRNKERLSGAYGRINKALGSLRAEYRDLAVKQSLNAKLTDAEIKRMETLSGRINQFDGALKKVDASMGLHQRNVGNYTGQWNGLGNSINQLTREAPAFANSMQTGFMAISNNIPTLVDEINRLKVANQQLVAEGKPTESVLKKIAGALFSWQTAISLGVTLLTVFGAQFFKWAFGMGKTNEELDKQKKLQEENNKKTAENTKKVAENASGLVMLTLALSKTNRGSKYRLDLMNQINAEYGTTLSNLGNEQKFQKQLTDLIEKYIIAKEKEIIIKANEEEFITLLHEKLTMQKELLKATEQLRKIEEARANLKEPQTNVVTFDKEQVQALREYNSQNAQLTEQYKLQNGEVGRLRQEIENHQGRLKLLASATLGLKDETTRSTGVLKEHGEAVKKTADYEAKRMEILEKTRDLLNPERVEKQLELEVERAKEEANILVLQREIELMKAKSGGNPTEIAKAEKDLIEAKKQQIDKELELELKKTESGSKKEELKLEAELAKLRLDNVELQKRAFNDLSKIIKATSDIFIQQSNRRLEAIDKEINKRQEQYNLYVELSKNGTIQAQQSLALEQKAIAEANRKKAEEQRRQERIKFAESAFSAYSANVEKGEKNPLLKTITDMTLLRQFILSLPTFEKGIEDTGANGKGVDGRGGFLSVLHPNERVLTKGQNSMIGDTSNQEVAETIYKHRTGQLVNMGEGATQIGGNWNLNPLLTEIQQLKDIIKNKPEHSVQAGEIIQGAMQIIETKKEGRTIKRNRYIIR